MTVVLLISLNLFLAAIVYLALSLKITKIAESSQQRKLKQEFTAIIDDFNYTAETNISLLEERISKLSHLVALLEEKPQSAFQSLENSAVNSYLKSPWTGSRINLRDEEEAQNSESIKPDIFFTKKEDGKQEQGISQDEKGLTSPVSMPNAKPKYSLRERLLDTIISWETQLVFRWQKWRSQAKESLAQKAMKETIVPKQSEPVKNTKVNLVDLLKDEPNASNKETPFAGLEKPKNSILEKPVGLANNSHFFDKGISQGLTMKPLFDFLSHEEREALIRPDDALENYNLLLGENKEELFTKGNSLENDLENDYLFQSEYKFNDREESFSQSKWNEDSEEELIKKDLDKLREIMHAQAQKETRILQESKTKEKKSAITTLNDETAVLPADFHQRSKTERHQHINHLLSQGHSVKDLSALTNMSYGEIELIAMLNKNNI